MNKRSVVLGWHILEPSGRLSYNDGREPLDRRWVTMKQKRKPELCTRGMHACRHVVDTLKYSSGGYLCRVKVRGNIQEGTDKLCGNERPIVKRMSVDDTDKLFREFALELCEESMKEVGFKPTKRVTESIEAMRGADHETLRKNWLLFYTSLTRDKKKEVVYRVLSGAIDTGRTGMRACESSLSILSSSNLWWCIPVERKAKFRKRVWDRFNTLALKTMGLDE